MALRACIRACLASILLSVCKVGLPAAFPTAASTFLLILFGGLHTQYDDHHHNAADSNMRCALLHVHTLAFLHECSWELVNAIRGIQASSMLFEVLLLPIGQDADVSLDQGGRQAEVICMNESGRQLLLHFDLPVLSDIMAARQQTFHWSMHDLNHADQSGASGMLAFSFLGVRQQGMACSSLL